MVACKAQSKPTIPFDAESARALLRELSTCKNPYSCAHGRPTIVHFSEMTFKKCSAEFKKRIVQKRPLGKILSKRKELAAVS